VEGNPDLQVVSEQWLGGADEMSLGVGDEQNRVHGLSMIWG